MGAEEEDKADEESKEEADATTGAHAREGAALDASVGVSRTYETQTRHVELLCVIHALCK